jgi:hypothetical protein
MRSLRIAVATASALGILGTAIPAFAATHEFTGQVLHVSTDNIKVENLRSGNVQSFLIVPHFDQVFQFDGKTTYQMKRLTAGNRVKVYYDERALGIRHADRIVVMNRI